MYFMSLAARYGGLEPFQNAVAGTGKFTDDCFIKAGEKIQEWVKNGYFPDGVNSLSEDDGQAKQLMYQETAGMLPVSYTHLDVYKRQTICSGVCQMFFYLF